MISNLNVDMNTCSRWLTVSLPLHIVQFSSFIFFIMVKMNEKWFNIYHRVVVREDIDICKSYGKNFLFYIHRARPSTFSNIFHIKVSKKKMFWVKWGFFKRFYSFILIKTLYLHESITTHFSPHDFVLIHEEKCCVCMQ